MIKFPVVDPPLFCAIGGVVALLAVASVLAAAWKRRSRSAGVAEVALRIRTWWGIVAVMGVALMLGRMAVVCLFALISLMAWREYLALLPRPLPRASELGWCHAAIGLQYVWVALGAGGACLGFIPVAMPLVLALSLAGAGATPGFLATLGRLHLGLMLTTFSLSYVPSLFMSAGSSTQGARLVLYLLVLTGLNDIAQFVWGRTLGGPKLVPLVSPRKTWAGLLGGLATTLILAVLLAPSLTPLRPAQALAAGGVIGFGGFLGDLILSAIKRDAGVGASGKALPGHGGILDRVDSLTLAAPLFAYALRRWWS